MELNSYLRGFVFFCKRNLANATANFIPKPIMKFLINPLSACIGQAMGLCQQNLDIYDFGILIIFCRKLEIISALGGSTLVGA